MKTITISSIIILVLVLFYFRGRVSDSIKGSNQLDFYNKSIKSEAHRLDMVINFQKQTAIDIATTLNVFDYNNEVLNLMAKSALFNQYNVHGVIIAYDLTKDTTAYCPYIYKSGDSLVVKNLNDSVYNFEEKGYYTNPRNLNKKLLSPPYSGTFGDHDLMVTYSVPFYKYNGYEDIFNGIVAIDILMKSFTIEAQKLGLTEGGSSFLISTSGGFLTSVKNEIQVVGSFSNSLKDGITSQRVLKDLREGKSGIVKIEEFFDEKNCHVFYTPLNSNNWGYALVIQDSVLLTNKFK
jgi:hypothetical protein